jgi:CRP-like cAMP-binding protein
MIIREGDESTEAYIIRSGSADVLKRSRKGEDVVIGILEQGGIFGEMGLIQDRPRSASVRARTDMEVEVVDAQIFTSLFSNEAMRKVLPLMRVLIERLRVADSRLADLESGARLELVSAVPVAGELTVEIVAMSGRAQQALAGRDRVLVNRFPYRVGRSEGVETDNLLNCNDLILLDSIPYHISRSHFALVRRGNACVFQDRGSRLGSLVNEVHVGGGQRGSNRQRLKAGSNSVFLGGYRSEFHFDLRVSGSEIGFWEGVKRRLFG